MTRKRRGSDGWMDEQVDKRIQGYWTLGKSKTNKQMYYYNYYHSNNE